MLRRAALPLLLLSLALRLDAAVHVWNGTASDRFSDAANWTGGSPAGDPDAELSFPEGTTRATLNNDLAGLTVRSIALAGTGYVLRGLPITLTAGAHIMTSSPAGNEVALDLILGGGVSILHVTAGDLTFSGAISGVGPLTKRGVGRTWLTGSRANTFSGATVVTEGDLRLMKPDSVAAVPGELFISNTGVNNEYGSASTVTREQIPDAATVHVGPYSNFYVGGVETIGGLTIGDAGRVTTGIPVGSFTSTDGKLILAGDMWVLSSSSNGTTLYGAIAIDGTRTIHVCENCSTRIDSLSEHTPGSGLILRGAGGPADQTFTSVNLTGTYRGPTTIENLRATITNPNTAVRLRSGRFAGSVASVIAEGGTLYLPDGVTTAGDLRLNPATTVFGSVTSQLPRLTVGGVLDLNRAKLHYEESGNLTRVLGTTYVLGEKKSAGAIEDAFSGVAEGEVIHNRWRVSYRGGDGNDLTFRDVGRFPTRILLSAAPSTVKEGDRVTLKTTFHSFPVPSSPDGTFTFYLGSTVVGTASMVDGAASVDVAAPAHGSYTYRAEFSGTPQFGPSSAVASIAVMPPVPVLTSIEPSTVKSGESVVVTVRGTNLLPKGRIVVDSSSGFVAEHVSNSEVRFTFTSARFEQDRTLPVEFIQPEPGSVRSNSLPLLVQATPAEKTLLKFETRAITAPVVPGGGAAWMSIAAASRTGGFVIEHRAAITNDPDNDGITRWEQTNDVPQNGRWLMTDMRDGRILFGEPKGTVRDPIAFPKAMFVRDTNGEYSHVFVPLNGTWDTMLVRPGVGAWYYAGSDGSARDRDGSANGLWLFSVQDMQSLSEASVPAGVQPGDVFLGMAWDTDRWFGDRVDEHLHETDGPGAVRFAPAFSVATVKEQDGVARVTLLRTGGSDGTVSVDYTTTDGTAFAGTHYAASAGRITFGAGEILKSIEVPLINDAIYSGETRFTIRLGNAAGTTITGSDSQTVVITEDEPAPQLRASDMTIAEGDEGTREIRWTVSVSGATRVPVTGRWVYVTSQSGSSIFGGEFRFHPGGPTSQTFTVPYVANRVPEESRVYSFFLSQVTNATTADVRGRVTIADDDLADLDIVDATVIEGKPGSVTVSISAGSYKPVTVTYRTFSGSATEGSDYTSIAGTLQFDRTVGRRTIQIPIAADAVTEGAESFTVVLSDAVNARIRRGTATVTILDTITPVVTASPLVAWEGSDAAFLFRMSTLMTTPVTFRATTSPGTASSPTDFPAKDELVTIHPGQLQGFLTMKLPYDAAVEGTETFTLTLSEPTGATIGTPVVTASILDNNDPLPDPALASVTISNVSLAEGNAGTAMARFTVSLPSAATNAVAVRWSTADASALAPSDYVAASGTLTFAPGETSKTIEVMVNGDTLHEIDETFTVVLANGRVGTARITNDDAVMPRQRPSGS
jgi:autotransporter-associated beta strand protein